MSEKGRRGKHRQQIRRSGLQLLAVNRDVKLATCSASQRKAVDSDYSEAEVEANSGAEEGWTPDGAKAGKGAGLEEPNDLSDVSDEESEEAGGTFRLGEQDERFQDFSKSLKVKDDAANRSSIVHI